MEKVGKEEFIKQLQSALNTKAIDLSLANLDTILDTIISKIEENVVEGKSVEFEGFGKFMLRQRSTRTDHDINTGKEITIKAHDDPAFEAGKIFKDMVK